MLHAHLHEPEAYLLSSVRPKITSYIFRNKRKGPYTKPIILSSACSLAEPYFAIHATINIIDLAALISLICIYFNVLFKAASDETTCCCKV